jgi:hypothetical protein
MTIEDNILVKVNGLPPDKKLDVLDFADFLRSKAAQTRRPKILSLKGHWKNAVDVGEDDITNARKELWGTFPRSDIA